MSLTSLFRRRLARLVERLRGQRAVFSRLPRARERLGRTELMSGLLLASVFLMIGSISYAVAVPSQIDGSTEFALLMETDDGAYVADGYPETFERDDSQSVVLEITNNGPTTAEYTIVVLAQRIERSTADTEAAVTEQAVLDRIPVTVEPDETRYRSYELAPTIPGETVRVNFLLFEGAEPDEPTRENAQRTLQLVTTVSESDDSTDGRSAN